MLVAGIGRRTVYTFGTIAKKIALTKPEALSVGVVRGSVSGESRQGCREIPTHLSVIMSSPTKQD